MQRLFILFIGFVTFNLLLYNKSFSQNEVLIQSSNGISIYGDNRIDTLIDLYATKALKAKTEKANQNKLKTTTITTPSGKVLSTAKATMGFRIMVLTTEDRNLAFKVRAQLLQNFTSQKPHYDAKSNLIKIKFGDFETEAEANKFIKKIEKLNIVNSPMYLSNEPVTIPIIKVNGVKKPQGSDPKTNPKKPKIKSGLTGIIVNT